MNTLASFSASKLIIPIIAAAVIVGGGAFYGGMKYAESKSPRGADFFARGGSAFGGQNLSSGERQQRFQEFGVPLRQGFEGQANVSGAFGDGHEGGSGFFARGGSASGGRGSSRPLSGEVILQSDDSLTIKLSDGSTKIVFVSDSTQITKSMEGVFSDLAEGKQIFVGGIENPDGSWTAKTIQLLSPSR